MTQFFRLDGQAAIVTGSGSGIGAGIARRLHAAGARIAIFDCDAACAETVAAEVDGVSLVGDVTVPDQVEGPSRWRNARWAHFRSWSTTLG